MKKFFSGIGRFFRQRFARFLPRSTVGRKNVAFLYSRRVQVPKESLAYAELLRRNGHTAFSLEREIREMGIPEEYRFILREQPEHYVMREDMRHFSSFTMRSGTVVDVRAVDAESLDAFVAPNGYVFEESSPGKFAVFRFKDGGGKLAVVERELMFRAQELHRLHLGFFPKDAETIRIARKSGLKIRNG